MRVPKGFWIWGQFESEDKDYINYLKKGSIKQVALFRATYYFNVLLMLSIFHLLINKRNIFIKQVDKFELVVI